MALNVMKTSERDILLKQIFWDYNISVKDINEVLKDGEKKSGILTGHIFSNVY